MTTDIPDISTRLRFGLQTLAAAAFEAIEELELAVVELTEHRLHVEAKINPTKPYKPRRLKLDPIHRMARQLYKMKSRNPNFQRKRKLYRKLYNRKNKMLLERRQDFVKNARHRMGLDKKD